MESPFSIDTSEPLLFRDLQNMDFSVDRTASHQSYSPYLPPNPPLPMFSPQPPDLNSTFPLTEELTNASLLKPACAQCKGRKYTFTSYFHNNKVFSRPPHELLDLIETSYTLKNRLQSLIFTYVLRSIDPSYVQGIEIELCNWEAEVKALARAVVARAVGCQQVSRGLEDVQVWAAGMMKQISEHVCEIRILDMPKGRSKELVVEFRKRWEEVWVAYVKEKGAGVDYCMVQATPTLGKMSNDCMEVTWPPMEGSKSWPN